MPLSWENTTAVSWVNAAIPTWAQNDKQWWEALWLLTSLDCLCSLVWWQWLIFVSAATEVLWLFWQASWKLAAMLCSGITRNKHKTSKFLIAFIHLRYAFIIESSISSKISEFRMFPNTPLFRPAKIPKPTPSTTPTNTVKYSLLGD